MRVFTASCIDSKTHYEMVLSECSYNSACAWIDEKYHPTEVTVKSDANYIYITIPGMEFVYDEERGYLLRK